MPPFVNLVAKRFGKLTVIRRGPNTSYGRTAWVCLCDCGTENMIVSASLVSGHSTSCGCVYARAIGERSKTHGDSVNRKQSAEYRVWAAMLQRCNNPANKDYPDYGGRGITVCERWAKFENFLSDMGRRPSRRYSIDRQKNDLGYFKENCEWVIHTRQTRNARSNIIVSVNGKYICLSEAAEILGIRYSRLWWCIRKKKMSLQDAVKDLR